MTLKQQFEALCNEYVNALKKILDCDNHYWIADDIGGVLCLNKDCYFLCLNDVRYIVDNEIKLEEVDAWYEYNTILGMISSDISTINLESWHKGCPRRSEEEIKELEELHKKTLDARKILENEIKMFK